MLIATSNFRVLRRPLESALFTQMPNSIVTGGSGRREFQSQTAMYFDFRDLSGNPKRLPSE